MYKVDLHTHSIISPDGGITEREYTEIIAKRILDCVAITDHNSIDFAQKMHKKLGDAIIVGEEIMTLEGEVIGLFLIQRVEPHQPIAKTVKEIHAQGGLVYIPHPFDPSRSHIVKKALQELVEEIDIIEAFNGRMFWKEANALSMSFALQLGLVTTASSDAHAALGIGNAYAIIEKPYTKSSLTRELKTAKLVTKYQPWLGYLAPKWNRIRKVFRKM